MSRLGGRLTRLERASNPGPGRYVIVAAARPWDDEAPGTIRSSGDGRNLLLCRPARFETDPIAGLTETQRALLRPEDRVVTIVWAEDWRERPDRDRITLHWTDDTSPVE